MTYYFASLQIYENNFPKFDGKNARSWVNKAYKFFMLNPNIDLQTKVIYDDLYLEGEEDH